MPATDQRLPVGEATRLGKMHFEQSIRAKLRPDDDGKWITIEVFSGDFEFADAPLDAPGGMRERHPDGRFFMMQVELVPDTQDRIRTPFRPRPQ